jgi:PAS domain S-box-containing protein
MPNLSCRTPRGVLYRYGFAAVVTAVALALRQAIAHLVGPGFPQYILFYPTVMLVALVSGLGPGIFATALSALLAVYWILPPKGFGISGVADPAGLVLFALTGMFITVVAAVYHRSRERLAAYERDAVLRETAEAISRERANLQIMFDAVNVGLLLIDESGTIQRVNNTVARWVGRELDACWGMPPGDLVGCIHALDESVGCGHATHCKSCPLRRAFLRAFESDQPVHDIEAEATFVLRGEPVRVWLEVAADPLRLNGRRHVLLAINNITARKQVEAALRRERDLCQSVMNGARNCHLVYLDRDFNFVRVNETYARGCGYTPEEMVGKNHFALYPHPENGAIFARVRDTGIPAEYHDKPFEFPDQPQRGITYWDWTLTPVKDSADQVEGLVLSLVETTDRKRAEAEIDRLNQDLQRRLAELQTFFDTAPIGLAIAEDPRGRRIRGNPANERMLGLPAGGELSKGAPQPAPYRCFQNGRELAVEELPMQRAVRGQTVAGQLLDVLRDDGQWLTLYSSTAPLFDETGAPRGAVGAFLDITELKQAEDALARSSRQRQRLVEASAAVVAQTTVEGLLDTIVVAARDLTGTRLATCGHGYTNGEFRVGAVSRSEEAATCPPGELFKVQRGGVYLELLEGRATIRYSGDELQRHSAWWGLPEGHAPLRGLLGARLTDAAGLATGLIMVSDKEDGSDFTEEDESRLWQLASITALAMQHIEARAAAEAANVAKSRFLASMSHELRTPMNAILGMTDLALGETLSPAVRDYLQTAKESADLLLELLNEILDFSRIEAGRFELEAAPFSFRRTVEQVVKTLGVQAYEKGLELVCDVADDLPPTLVGDPLRMRQVMMNLLSNAIKFTPKGEVIVTAVVREATAGSVTVEFSVADSGIGISAEHQEKIFAPFTQADASTTRRFGGTGLGLAISQRLIQLMGGRIWVESHLGEGSTFSFAVTLPMADESELKSGERAFPDLETFRDVPVLVVAENGTSRRILKQILASWAMRPEVVPDVPSALAKIHEAAGAGTPYRLVLADAAMPGIDGYTLAGWLQQDRRLAGAIILMVSAGDRQIQPDRCARLDATALDKPVSRSALFNAVANALGGGGPATRSSDAEPPPPARGPARTLSVLLAEDTPANQKLVSHLLRNRGHSVAVAANGQTAVSLLCERDFDLLLMDVQMPVMDGFQATAEVRKLSAPRKSQIPIVAMTAHALKGDAERCLAAGMDAYVSKPIKGAELVELIERLAAPGVPEVRPASEPPVPMAIRATAPIFDRDEALRRCDGDPSLLQEMIGFFFDEADPSRAHMQAALADGRLADVATAAHRFKGTIGYVGSLPALQATVDVEQAARSEDVPATAAALEQLGHYLGCLKQALSRYRDPP